MTKKERNIKFDRIPNLFAAQKYEEKLRTYISTANSVTMSFSSVNSTISFSPVSFKTLQIELKPVAFISYVFSQASLLKSIL